MKFATGPVKAVPIARYSLGLRCIAGAYLALSNEKQAKEVIAQRFKIQVINATYSDFKRQMPLDVEPSRAGAESVIEQLQAIGTNGRSPRYRHLFRDLRKMGFSLR